MAEVSWDKKYDIDIRGIDGRTAWCLGQAIQKYLATNPFPKDSEPDTKADLEEIMEICGKIDRDEEAD